MHLEFENLIIKKLARDISEEEAVQLENWLTESKSNKNTFEEYEKSWKQSELTWGVSNSKEVYESISDHLGFKSQPKPRVIKFKQDRSWLKYAASIVILIGVSITFYYSGVKSVDTQGISDNLIIKKNAKGKKSQIKLPDGTMVKLNSGSYLEYPRTFGLERRIKLIGEAFFDVKRDVSRPFIVESENLNVRVLGTSFNIKAFPYDDSYTVAVASGLVSVTDQRKSKSKLSMQLKANELVTYEHLSGEFKKDTFDSDHYFAWKNGILDFHNADFNEIITRLERWYGVKFVVLRESTPLNGFSGRYENASLRHVLEGISFANDFKFSQEGGTVIIK
ncbi:MAG: DUF4974 domain-containing protein [Cyclobacteriaceae bacterium]